MYIIQSFAHTDSHKNENYIKSYIVF